VTTASSETPLAPLVAAPVRDADRILMLDVLRGVAVLGILAMNIISFGLVSASYMNPMTNGELVGADRIVWLAGAILADQKFMTIFSLLFGAGVVLMTDRAAATGRSPAGVHYRRMGWLILFGLLHAHLLWFGDILYMYGMCGLLAYLLRRLRCGWLFVVGAVLITVPFGLMIASGWSMQFWPPEAIDQQMTAWAPDAETRAEEIATYQGGWLGQMSHRVPTALAFETFFMAIWGFWRITGLMLIGMALYRLGVVTGQRSNRFYLGLLAGGLLPGLALVLEGLRRNEAAGWTLEYSMFFGSQFNYWGSLGVAAAWIAVVALVVKAVGTSTLTAPFAAVGRMALTNYFMQTIICTTVFYGHGFGLYGELGRAGLLVVVVAVWVAELIWSPIWLHFFRFGPFEWLWRSLTYWRLQPLLRSGA
jgi:uncharacterized protein